MSAGAIPVLVVRDWVRPFEELVDWSAFSFIFSPDQVPDIINTLRAVPPKTLMEMQVRFGDLNVRRDHAEKAEIYARRRYICQSSLYSTVQDGHNNLLVNL